MIATILGMNTVLKINPLEGPDPKGGNEKGRKVEKLKLLSSASLGQHKLRLIPTRPLITSPPGS